MRYKSNAHPQLKEREITDFFEQQWEETEDFPRTTQRREINTEYDAIKAIDEFRNYYRK